MPHLAFLGWMLEKGGGFVVAIFPKGWILSQDIPIKSNCIHILCVKWILCKFHKYPYLPITHHASLASQTQPTPVQITFSITHVILKSICTGVRDTKAIHAGVGWVWLARLHYAWPEDMGYVGWRYVGLCPSHEGLLHYVNSPLNIHQASGIVGGAYHW